MPNARTWTEPADLARRLRSADAPTPALLADVIVTACPRLPALPQAGDRSRLADLIAHGAWVDAALALVGLELPFWQLRRIAYDDGEWHCALSRHREMPDWLDGAVEFRHADLALAILGALVEARGVESPASRASVPPVRHADRLYEPVSGDHFG